jgi:O-antigen/teichoic acid export membrane protein
MTAATMPEGRLAVSTGSMVAGRLIQAVVGWAGTVLVARELGQEGFGQFTLVFSLLGMLSIVTDLGIGQAAVAAYGRYPGDRAVFAGAYMVLRSVLGLIGYGIAVGFVVLMGYPSQVLAATAVGGLVVLVATPSHALDIAFQVRDRLPVVALAGVLGRLAQLGLTVALVIHGGSVVWFVVPAVVNDLLVLLWKWPAAHRLMDFRYCVDLRLWSDLVRQAVPLTIGTAFVTLYYRVDSVMLASIDDFSATGVYGVAYKFVDVIHFVPSALSVALIAPLAVAWSSDKAAFLAHVRAGLRILATAAAGALVGFWLYAEDLVSLLYGDAYAEAGAAARILVTAEAFGFMSRLAITALLAANRHRIYPLITFLGLALNVSTNLVLIPRFSFEGAAVTTLLTEVVVAVLLWGRLGRLGVGSIVEPGLIARVATAAGASLLVGLLLGAVVAWLPAAIAAGVVFLMVAVRLDLLSTDWSVTSRSGRSSDGLSTRGRGR